ncbi:MAG: pilus assembly protein [Candidatus Edwardsbacteria bacterium RIFOXYD12_FULL_50_11]|uniref:Pilus assembly protein n=1 Tax=Candidatus Edwardsbacteria bacterium GWF2_54_11 TaxID=1817851 RepID=A0A1F5RHK8_9BACT|nr:MAG: pilus assembly protein [Candidatus Edwardsbacteria bacterium RifOxyC12_full_54_24]OGF11074.1 MAG: pilus assembly protein [Candidatus Edwardsbacteria bacterium GWE2_54_12]OGF14027.1 MAG: pilus assembly protein [Candidatus Edwardsbacteria bacterium GWF2_54_11]OGF16020.1 MAG: pilus assembly protein [Candidatus Edwardsbacteria bacterium RIFOXYD12_FULL_50_11]OGJ17569.1 MAG: pilus assembly protein [Candidatus Edwardsbacteria bacterium RifOxyB12_full_52_30]OGT06068.1 MAG: pilus assembly prote
MVYADTDFFLAIMKNDDWLKSNARKIYEKYKKELRTSVITLIELLLLSEKYRLDPENIVLSLYSICSIEGIDRKKALLTSYYIKYNKLNVFDALHAAYSAKDDIISSDKAFDDVGIKRIKLET